VVALRAIRLRGICSPPRSVKGGRTPSPFPGAERSIRPGSPPRTLRATRLGPALPAGAAGSPRGPDTRELHPGRSRTSTRQSPDATALSEGRRSATVGPCVLRIPQFRRLIGRHASYCFILPCVSSHPFLSRYLQAVSLRPGLDGGQHQTTTTKQRSRWAVAVKAKRPRNQPQSPGRTTLPGLRTFWRRVRTRPNCAGTVRDDTTSRPDSETPSQGESAPPEPADRRRVRPRAPISKVYTARDGSGTDVDDSLAAETVE